MNLTSIPMLSIVTFLPLFGVFWMMFLKDDESGKRNARWIAFYVTMGTFLLSLYICWGLV